MLALSFLFSVAPLIYLGWLWNADANQGNAMRRSIITTHWATTSITVAAIAIRTASSTQTVLGTSMLAALALENPGIRLKYAADFSIMRFLNSGPLQSLKVFIQGIRGRGLTLHGICSVGLVILLALITTVLQFTSTILLGDIREGLLLSQSIPINQTCGLLDFAPTLPTNY
jgi:hypothetical protein